MINTEIYGIPTSWTDAQYMSHAKYVNFNTVANPENRLLDGLNRFKTPSNELIENSICTQALGVESLYSNVLWVHDYGNGVQYVKDEKPQVPYFYAECVSTDGNVQNNEGSISPNYNCNSWKPYIVDDYYQNKSAYSKPIAEFNPKKIVYILRILAETANGNNTQEAIIGNYIQYPQFRLNYPYLKAAWLAPYVDISDTDTPNRDAINYNALFGICPNVEIDANYANIGINYAYWRSCRYNVIPIWGVFGSFNYFDDNYTGALCEPSDLVIEDNVVSARRLIDDQLLEYLIQQAACFGVFVKTGTAGDIANIALDHNSIMLGLLDENGVGHGEYTRGSDNRLNPIWEWASNRDSPFDPYLIPDPNRYEDSTTLPNWVQRTQGNNVYIHDPSTPGLVYGLTQGVVNEIKSLSELQFGSLFAGQEPLENIIASRTIHLKPPSGSQLASSEPVQLAAYTCQQVSAPKLADEFTRVEFPSKPIFPEFGNFLDYEPYTTVSIYIPYCGAMKLPTAVFMGHNCKFTMNINLRTGEIEAIIYVDNIEFASIAGNAGEDFAVTGLAMSTYASKKRELEYKQDQALFQGMMGLAGHIAGSTISGSMGNVGGVMSQAVMAATSVSQTISDYYYIDYELDHIAPASLLIQKANASIAQLNCLTPFLLIMRPTYEFGFDEEKYAKTVGHACYRIGNLKSFHGMTSAINPVLDGISATLTEKQMIIEALREGVILDE